jgi:hypothetical protein
VLEAARQGGLVTMTVAFWVVAAMLAVLLVVIGSQDRW